VYLGVDIGSSSSKAVVLDQSATIVGERIVNIGTGSKGPAIAVDDALEQAGIHRSDIRFTVVTGYGRMMFEGADKQITEISCHAKGVKYLVPSVGSLIDIGGQDVKVIRINPQGGVENFVMNEKCAAGTGRFLEVAARVLDCGIGELSDLAARGSAGVTISSTCTVFAESEMISQLSAGNDIADVAQGALRSVAERISGLGNRIGLQDDVVMSGGAALNLSLVKAIEEVTGKSIVRLEDPQAVGALGAAYYALEAVEAV